MAAEFQKIERLFHQALMVADAGARREMLVAECDGDAACLQEVLSLLQADEEAARLLNPDLRDSALNGAVKTPELGSDIVSADPCRLVQESLGGLRGGSGLDVARATRQLPEQARAEYTVRLACALRASTRNTQKPADDESPALLDHEIPGFKILRRLGTGGMGVVYEAFETRLRRKVAIKTLKPGTGAASLENLLSEARKAASLRDPGIVTIHTVMEIEGSAIIVMELVEGYLIDRCAEGATYEQRAVWLRDLARSLAHAHQRGVIHRDLKPANVLVTPEQKPVILDFGLALNTTEATSLSGGFQGTPHYSSPEQAAGLPLTSASDVFSFGSLMFRILTGRAPFRGESIGEVLQAVCTEAPPFPRDIQHGVPEDLQAVCMACMAWKPADRPSASAVAAELDRYLSGEPVRLRPALYSDVLRRRLAEHSLEVESWRRQGMISTAEADQLAIIHRGILEDEDHWIVETRTLSKSMTLFYTSTWMVVVAALLLVWQLKEDLNPLLQWILPGVATFVLSSVGCRARRHNHSMAASAFLAAAALSIAPTAMAFLGYFNLLASHSEPVGQLLGDAFTNYQTLVACALGFGVSLAALGAMRMTGFAWTAAVFGTAAYVSFLSIFGWVDKPPEVQAAWCLPLVLGSGIGWAFERISHPRWAFPYYWGALVILVGSLDLMAVEGPTLKMIGLGKDTSEFLNRDRLYFFSLALNGYLFLLLMLIAERARSLDIRRISRVIEGVALLHLLGPLYMNAMENSGSNYQSWDVAIYWATTCCLLVLGPLASRWRVFAGGLVGVALGSYLLVELGIVPKQEFILGAGAVGLLLSVGSYLRLHRRVS
ncbi:MAG: serine/threonine protein kinase [Verrucomicrobia bacterium]|nr:serine/threonine protein kinase [Verrucomicrobiota bacterium]